MVHMHEFFVPTPQPLQAARSQGVLTTSLSYNAPFPAQSSAQGWWEKAREHTCSIASVAAPAPCSRDAQYAFTYIVGSRLGVKRCAVVVRAKPALHQICPLSRRMGQFILTVQPC